MSPNHSIKLTKKGEEWQWLEEEQGPSKNSNAYNIHPNPSPAKLRHTVQIRDPMPQAMPLGQFCPNYFDDGKNASGRLYFQRLDSAERNYKVHEKNFYWLSKALRNGGHVLEGTKHTIEILTDHRNLTYFRRSQNLNCQEGSLLPLAHKV